MTEQESRSTYGLLSKTILHTLTHRSIGEQDIFLFSLHMQWGIIMGHPDTQKSPIAAKMLQQITQQIQQEKKTLVQPDYKKIFLDNRDHFLKIFKRINTHRITSALHWYITWKEHCSRLLTKEPATENCFQLFLILKDSLAVKPEDFLLSTTTIHETLLYAAAR